MRSHSKLKLEWKTIHSSLHILRLIWIFLRWTNAKNKNRNVPKVFSLHKFFVCAKLLLQFSLCLFCILHFAACNAFATRGSLRLLFPIPSLCPTVPLSCCALSALCESPAKAAFDDLVIKLATCCGTVANWKEIERIFAKYPSMFAQRKETPKPKGNGDKG